MNYVKFIRGTADQWNKFTERNDDTLYFITDTDGSVALYLGGKYVAGSGQELGSLGLNSLLDVVLENVQANQVLAFDGDTETWLNKSLEEVLSVFIGATTGSNGRTGLVPAPELGKTDLFLKSDGTWAEPVTTKWVVSYNNDGNLSHNEIIASLTADRSVAAGDTIIIKDPIGTDYKYNPYIYNGSIWLATTGLHEANSVYVGNQSLSEVLNSLHSADANLSSSLGSVQTSVVNLEALLNSKANAADVYTKQETEEYVNKQIANTDHLKRIKVNSLDSIDPTAPGADKYIYMVPSGTAANGNKYNEYIIVDGILEAVGTWEVDLNDYAKVSQVTELAESLNGKVDKVEGSRLINAIEISKLAGIEEGAQANYIREVSSEFKVENGLLSLLSINSSHVSDLENLLATKADKKDVTSLQTVVGTLQEDVNSLKQSMLWSELT